MSKRGKTFIKKQQDVAIYVRFVLTVIVTICLAVAGLIVRIDTEASGDHLTQNVISQPANPVSKPTPEGLPRQNIPPQTLAIRTRITFNEKKDLQVTTGVDSYLLVSPEIASAEIKNRFTLSILGLRIGETILLVTSGQRRFTYVIEVVPRPSAAERQSQFIGKNGGSQASATSGSFTTLYAQGSGGGPTVLRQNVDYRKKLSGNKTLRVSGELFKLFGNTDRNLAIARVKDFALNRLSLGLDTHNQSIDILDSQVNISPLSLNNYTLRGFHLVSTPKSAADRILPAKGIEIFAGLARPSLAFFDNSRPKIAGVMIPIVNGDSFQARAGVIAISSERNTRERGGTIFRAEVAYAPKKQIFADAEIAFENGDLSWRARFDLRFTKYGASGEITRFARSSPLNSIGAQPGGRKSESLSFYWRPVSSLGTSVGYNHTRISRQANLQLADYDRSLLFANANFTITKGSRINLRYTDQKIETAFPGSLSKFQIQTRTFLIGNNQRLSQNWSNTIEARFNFSREANAGEGLEKGFSVKEQLRFAWRGGSITGFLNYTHKTPSLTSMIVRNPQLLPPLLQTAFALDPAEFLRTYRDRLEFLLGGIELPQTRSFDASASFQKTFSRFTVTSEMRYNASEIYAVNQKNLYTSAGLGVRLDNANSLQVNGWKTLSGSRQSGITISYTHQFGLSGDEFQFSRLFNFNRGKIRGRVFYDLNGNGLLDRGEPGVVGMKIQIDGKRSVISDKDGNYEFAANEGRHRVVLLSSDLGVRLLADTPTEQYVTLNTGQKLDLNFGVRDFGSISGRVLNDADLSPGTQTQHALGLGGVKIILRSAETGSGSFVLDQLTGAGGTYDFPNLRPGKYLIEIDSASLPANFRIPGITGSLIIIEPLRSLLYDIPIAAQRSIAGIVFIDKDGDGQYTPGKDEPLAGASVTVENKSSISGVDGAYLLRNLPAGKIQLLVCLPNGVENTPIVVELGAEPVTQRAINIPIPAIKNY